MSIKRINSTGRRKILRGDARIFVRPDPDGVLTFDATIDLTDYGLPDDAHVFVEAYRQTTFMRFPHGTVAAPQPPARPGTPAHRVRHRDGLAVPRQGDLDGRSRRRAAGRGLTASRSVTTRSSPTIASPLLPPAPGELGQETWRSRSHRRERPAVAGEQSRRRLEGSRRLAAVPFAGVPSRHAAGAVAHLQGRRDAHHGRHRRLAMPMAGVRGRFAGCRNPSSDQRR